MGDLSLGETNHADNGTELTGGTLARDWGGNNYIFKVDGATISPLPPGGVMGIEASGFGNVAIHAIGGLKAEGTSAGSPGVLATGVVGVEGQGTRFGLEGLLTGANVPANRIERAAVVGSAAGSNLGIGVMGISDNFDGVLGSSQNGNGVEGLSGGGGFGVLGQSDFIGVKGVGSNSGDGVSGASTSGRGGVFTSDTGTGIDATSTSGIGVAARSTSGPGGTFTSGTGTAIDTTSTSGIGVVGRSTSGSGGFFTSFAAEALVAIAGGTGNGVRAQSATGNGVLGSSTDGAGVFGDSQNQVGVAGRSRSTSAAGVFGLNEQFIGVSGGSTSGPGVFGHSQSQAGIMGTSVSAAGIFGFGDAAFQAAPAVPPAGVLGVNDKSVGVLGSSVGLIGAWGNTDKGLGVVGTADLGAGVPTDRVTDQGIGVIGLANTGFGIVGMSTSGTGVYGSSTSSLAGHFKGPVTIEGALTVIGGAKSAVVPHPDGSARQLYCVESPESWFEDFGEAQLVDGQARVQLEPGFAALVELTDYHVFLTPYGETRGLFVAERDTTGFRVCEQQGGANGVRFAYRVIAKRKDIVADRLAKVALPQRSNQQRLPNLQLGIVTPNVEQLTTVPPLPAGASTVT